MGEERRFAVAVEETGEGTVDTHLQAEPMMYAQKDEPISMKRTQSSCSEGVAGRMSP